MPLSYFVTPYRKQQQQLAKNSTGLILDHDKKYGTVGAVALDKMGHISAGTSTGGLVNKAFGRVEDSPIVGAGTFADDRTCGVSATGVGELFIQHSIAADIHFQMLYKSSALEAATQHVVLKILPKKSGGVIAIDKDGKISIKEHLYDVYRLSGTGRGRNG